MFKAPLCIIMELIGLSLTPGTSGEALKTQGAGANVVWGAVSSTGDFANGGDTATANRTLGNNDAFSLGLETNAVSRLSISATGFVNNTLGMVGNPTNVATSVTTAANTNAASAGADDNRYWSYC